MIIVPENKIDERWDTLPENLTGALTSTENSNFIMDLASKMNVPEEKISTILGVVGYVLFGFLRPDELGRALMEQAGLDQKTATSFQETIDRRIFAPLKQDIAAAYQPFDPSAKPAPSAAVMRDIGTAGAGAPPPSPVSTASTVNLSAKGWSQLSPNDPLMKVSVIRNSGGKSAPAPVPLGTVTPSATPKPATPAAPKSAPAPAGIPKPSAPVMIQQNTQFKAAAKNVDFRIPSPNMGSQVNLNAARMAPRVQPAVVEFGGGSPRPQQPIAPKMPSVPPLAANPLAKNPERTVSEITAAPRPQPQQQQPVPQKVIVKNFTDESTSRPSPQPQPPQPPQPPRPPQPPKPL